MSEMRTAIDEANRTTLMQLWQADPHHFGPGKVHIIDPENDTKTYCGQFLAACPGKPTTSLRASCKTCLSGEIRRRERRIKNEIRRREQENNESKFTQSQIERKQQYYAYLETPKWREKRQAVLRRANHVCEGCGLARATQAHHLTYEHIFDEFLWELRAVCKPCHDRAHRDRAAS